MNKSWTLLSLISALLLLSSRNIHAQVVTNKAVLQQASQVRAREENTVHKLALDMAARNGWPLVLRFKNHRIATLRGVDAKGLPIYVTTTDNLISAATIRTNTLWSGGSTGLNLSGSTIPAGKIAVWDEGKVRPTHVELTGRIDQVDGSSTLSDHSTHVSGTMIATGVNPLAKGMSYGAKQLNAYDYVNDESEMMAAAAGGLLVSNHSYADIAGWNYNSDLSRWEWYGQPGDSVDIKFGLYDDDTRIWDSIAYNAPQYLICKAAGNNRGETGPAAGQPYYRLNASGNLVAAGNRSSVFGNANYISNNDGYNIIATYGCSKNVLTLGAVNPIPGGYSQSSDVVLADFSSWGPTGDGRIKPDLVADGVNVLSSISTADNAYDIYSGTSMATPATAGSSFLLQEYYQRLHGTGNFMRAATLKGLLIHTADEAGPSPGPDYQYGWGLINMQKAASVITSDTMATNKDQLIKENTLTNSTEDADSLTVVASGKVPLTATICWTDPPAVDANVTGHNFKDTVRKLVNDLDLRITDLTTGTVSMPWVLNPASPAAAATTGDNIRDNVEKIEVDSLIPGRSYKIKISHKGTLARTSQAYSLLISGVGGTPYCTSTSTGAAGTYISNVSFSNVNNNNTPAGCKTYSDFTGIASGALPIGQIMPLNISYLACSGSGAATRIAVYIDFNNNGSFTDAGELVAQSGALNSITSTLVYSTNIVVPTTVTANTFTRMRIVVQDGAGSAPAPCGTYTAGETQDYRVRFTTPSTDVGVADLEYPTVTSCASDSQIVTIRIRNYGTTPLNNVPVTTVIKNGATTVATLTANCTDTIPAKSDVLFTYSTFFNAVGGTTYTFTSYTGLSGDPNTGNDTSTTSITANANSNTPAGAATLCGTNATTATLTSTATGNDLPLWYTSATATTPIASGTSTTTTTIPSNKTYYLGLNDLNTSVGPATKLTYANGAGAYFRFGGNFIQFTTSVPLTLKNARMYFAHNGQVSLTLATLVSWSGESYNYIPLYNTSIDVYATKPTPTTAQQTNITAGDNTDTGGIFNLNIPVPTPGTYILIIDCSDSTSTFVNVLSSGTVPYPLTIPGVISITKNSFKDDGHADSLTYYKQFYYPFYDLTVSLNSCPSTSRTAITATTEGSPTITLNGGIFTSSAATGNQWYRDSVAISGETAQTDSAIYSGKYYTLVTDPVTGCQLQSNIINFVSTGTNDLSGAAIGLQVQNPNNGVFPVIFNVATKDNVSIEVINFLGQKVYEADYPDYVGAFSNQVNAPGLASGVYVLKVIIGNTTYVRRILVKK